MYVQRPKQKPVELGKWRFYYSYGPDWKRMESFSRCLSVGLFKPTKRPPEGAEFSRGEYKGFIFTVRFLLPVIVDRWR